MRITQCSELYPQVVYRREQSPSMWEAFVVILSSLISITYLTVAIIHKCMLYIGMKHEKLVLYSWLAEL